MCICLCFSKNSSLGIPMLRSDNRFHMPWCGKVPCLMSDARTAGRIDERSPTEQNVGADKKTGPEMSPKPCRCILTSTGGVWILTGTERVPEPCSWNVQNTAKLQDSVWKKSRTLFWNSERYGRSPEHSLWVLASAEKVWSLVFGF